MDQKGLFGVFEHHYIVEIIAVVTFLFLYELVLKPLFINLRDWREARKYNIAGKYISYYDDINASGNVKQVAEMTISQKGKKIVAIDIMKDVTTKTSRKWRLEGKLLHGHMIVGAYREISHRDSRSVGAFFVAQNKHTMDFSGFWCGWDEANNKLNTGEYVFRRKPKGLVFEEFTVKDRAKIARLSEISFGHNYFVSSIENKIDIFKQTAKIFVARDSSEKNSIVGFSLCYMLPKLSVLRFLKISASGDNSDDFLAGSRISDEIIESDRNGKIAVMQTICVSETTRQRGVGRGLFDFTEDYLQKFSPTVMLAPAWNAEGKMSASMLLSSLGYNETIEIDNYWKSDCDAGIFSCPSRKTECKCKMTLFCKTS